MGEEFWFNLLGSIGVPTTICLYTLYEVNRSLKELTRAINQLMQDIDKRLDRLERIELRKE